MQITSRYALIISLSGLTACSWLKPATVRLTETREGITKKFQKELYRQEYKTNQGTLNVNWNNALDKMYLTNPELIQADHRIEDARDQQKQIWKDMIPSLNVAVDDSFTLGELGDAFSDPSLRINSFINLGNLLSLPKDIYSRKLNYMGAELQAEQMMRQQVISLYRIFQQQRLLKLEKKAIDLEGRVINGIVGIGGAEILSLKTKHREALESWTKNYREWKSKVGDFFMAGYDEINLQHTDLPEMTYKPSELDFTDTQRWGMLQLNLLALEQIAEDGRLLETYLRYAPRANLGVSAPSIYSNTSSESFQIENTRLSPSLNWSLDSRGSISKQLRRLKREEPIKQWRKDKRQRDEIEKLLEGRKALSEIQQELVVLRKAMDAYRGAIKAGLITDHEKSIITLRKLREREVRLTAKEIEICTSFWLIDESRWKSITKKWLATRTSRSTLRKKNRKK